LARILIAAADPEERKSLGSAFRVTGNVVVEAPDAGTCLDILLKQPPDALVLDPRLPGLEVSQLLRQMRRNPSLNGMRVSLLAHDMDAKLWEFLGRQFFDLVVEERGPEAAGVLAAPPEPGRGRKGPKTGGAKKTEAAAKVESRRILVVEDEPTYSLLLGTEFRAIGWQTVRVESAEAGLEALQRETFDAVLSDINLPGMKGNDFALKVRAAYPGVKVLLMTGMPKDRCPKVPKDVPVLPKPISVKELMAAMRFLRQH
jgi:DNA-binding response OmpR family regulator